MVNPMKTFSDNMHMITILMNSECDTMRVLEEDTVKTFSLDSQPERMVREDILPFWMRLWDEQCGGWYGAVRGDGTLVREADKSLVVHARLLWTFSAAYQAFGAEDYRRNAQRALDFLRGAFYDAECGGYVWMVDRAGRMADGRKQAYGQAFCLYALSEYAMAFDDSAAREEALAVYRLLRERFHDAEAGGYFEVLDRGMTAPLPGVRMLEDDVTAVKTMNTQLHVLEALTNLMRMRRAPEVARDLREVAELFLDRIFDAGTGHLRMFFDKDWRSLSDRVTYGHDIECAWLLGEAAQELGDSALTARAREMSLRLAHSALAQGIGADGGLDYEREPGKWVDHDRCWWVQAECAVGMMYAYRLSEEAVLRDASLGCWRFIQEHVVDREGGEWFRRVRPGGAPRRELYKVDAWKCPYHNTRACLEMMKEIK
jgi:mannobiose 2-epimerase